MDASTVILVVLLLALPIPLALYGGRAIRRDIRDRAWGFAVCGVIVVAVSVIVLGLLAYGFSGIARL